MFKTIEKVVTSPIMGQLATTAAKTVVVCGIVLGSSIVAGKIVMGDFVKMVAKTVGERLAEKKEL